MWLGFTSPGAHTGEHLRCVFAICVSSTVQHHPVSFAHFLVGVRLVAVECRVFSVYSISCSFLGHVILSYLLPAWRLLLLFFFHSLLRIFHRLKVSILMKSYSLTAPVVDDNFGVKSEDTVRIRPKILSSPFF